MYMPAIGPMIGVNSATNATSMRRSGAAMAAITVPAITCANSASMSHPASWVVTHSPQPTALAMLAANVGSQRMASARRTDLAPNRSGTGLQLGAAERTTRPARHCREVLAGLGHEHRIGDATQREHADGGAAAVDERRREIAVV